MLNVRPQIRPKIQELKKTICWRISPYKGVTSYQRGNPWLLGSFGFCSEMPGEACSYAFLSIKGYERRGADSANAKLL